LLVCFNFSALRNEVYVGKVLKIAHIKITLPVVLIICSVVVHSSTYLGPDVNCNNDISAEIQKLILAANSCFHGLRKHLRPHLISKITKILKYKVLIRPVLTYASETWTLSKTNERRLSLLEGKVLRCTFGAKQENET